MEIINALMLDSFRYLCSTRFGALLCPFISVCLLRTNIDSVIESGRWKQLNGNHNMKWHKTKLMFPGFPLQVSLLLTVSQRKI